MTLGLLSSSTTQLVSLDKLAVAGGGSGSVTFSGFSDSYDSLLLVASTAFSTNISGWIESYPSIRFNNDDGPNYSRIRTSGINTTNSQSGATGMDFGTPGPDSSIWPRTSTLYFEIIGYNVPGAATTAHAMSYRTINNTPTGRADERFFYTWYGTATVNVISIVTGHSGGSPSGTFQPWSKFALYGVKK